MDKILQTESMKELLDDMNTRYKMYQRAEFVLFGINEIKDRACFYRFYDYIAEYPNGKLYYLIKLNNLDNDYGTIVNDLDELMQLFSFYYELIDEKFLFVKITDKEKIPLNLKYSLQLLSLCFLRALDSEFRLVRKLKSDNLRKLLINFNYKESRTAHNIHANFSSYTKNKELLGLMVDKYLETISNSHFILSDKDLLKIFETKFEKLNYIPTQTFVYNLLEDTIYGQN